MEQWDLRILGNEQCEDALSLYHACDSDFVLPLSHREVNAEVMMRQVRVSGKYVGCYSDNRMIACGGYRTHSPGEGELHGILVQPESRGRGIGRMVTIFLLEHADRVGIRSMEVSTWEESSGSRMFHSLGFREIDRFPDPEKRPEGVRTVRFLMDLREFIPGRVP